MATPEIVSRRRASANFTVGGPTTRTASLVAPTGTVAGDLVVITTQLWTSATFGAPAILGSISVVHYDLVTSFGTPDGYLIPPATRQRSLYTTSRAGFYESGDGPYVATFQISEQLVGDARAVGFITATSIRNVDSYTVSTDTFDLTSSTWPLGSGSSDNGVFGVAVREPISGSTNLVSAGTTSTDVFSLGVLEFWDFQNTTWTLPTIAMPTVPGKTPGHAFWLELTAPPPPPPPGGLFVSQPLGGTGLITFR